MCFSLLPHIPAKGKSHIQVYFRKLHPSAVPPKRGTSGSAGYDLTATSVTEDPSGLPVLIFGTGLAVEIPRGFAGFIFPRSSCYKYGMDLTNCVGVIDSDYRGEIKAVFMDHYGQGYKIGDRIAQMIILPVPEVEYVETDRLTETLRGTGGYGSTGK